ncbi:hypothetical protein [Mariniblastus fucicola]|uniref:Leucine Rich repeats (2 copies) n=1 Tax=Mariniblastus fucicola TaxID=980251 RepID=A0A5B9P6U8_9BACT|nr:hypothetical protein [Mariniblastus fucicola]QEG21998.1 Leucine Rich repeats (2 copies) [Mariniblastus fucicola]
MTSSRAVPRFNLKFLLAVTAVLALWVGWTGSRAGSQASAVAKIVQGGGTVQYDAPLEGVTKEIGKVTGNDYFQTVVIVRAEGSQFDDSITEPIGRLSNLQSLSLLNASVTDAGIEHLTSCGELKHLDLMHTLVSDDCISSLMGLQNLNYVNLEGSRVTKKGAQSLQALRPGLEVKHHFLE